MKTTKIMAVFGAMVLLSWSVAGTINNIPTAEASVLYLEPEVNSVDIELENEADGAQLDWCKICRKIADDPSRIGIVPVFPIGPLR